MINIELSKRTKRILLISAMVYVAICSAFYFLQEKIIFKAVPLDRDYAFNFTQPYKEINLPVTAQKNLNIIQFTVPDSLRKGIVLYFHGNRKNITRYALYAPFFTKNNYEVWMVDYPGYGKTTGERTEKAMYEDATIVYNMARSLTAKEHIIIYGKSLGTGVATYLASKKDCKRVILETPYYSLYHMIGHFTYIFPIRFLANYDFPSWKYLPQIEAPITIFHGTDDGIIPIRQAKKLSHLFTNKYSELIEVKDGSHNNLYDFKQVRHKLDSLLQVP